MTKRSYHHGDLRSALLEAARNELEASGLEGFSLRKVAARAGVSHAAPAHHFKDTAGLLTALATLGFRRFIAAMERRQADAGDDPRAQLLGAGLGYLDFAREEKSLFRLIHASQRPNADDPDLCAAGEDAFMFVLERVAKATGAPIDDEMTYMHGAAIWSMAHGLADLLSNGRLVELAECGQAAYEERVLNILSRSFPV